MPVPVAHKIAGMTPTREQAAILQTAREIQSQTGLRVQVVCAGAGTGKTATLKMLEQTLSGKGQYTAFNRSLVEDSRKKFIKAAVNTGHSLAFRAVGKNYSHRLDAPRIKSDRVGQMLGLQSISVTHTDIDGNSKSRVLDAGFLAGQVMAAVRKFCQSDDIEITDKHFEYIDGIDNGYISEDGSSKRGYTNNNLVRHALLPFAKKAWMDLPNPKGILPFNADVYVKVWELDKPYIAADYILLDESQDTAPVMLSILRKQTHAMLILVGDENQMIYQWRGAVNAAESFPDAPRNLLSQSFRFGQAIADVANSILATLEVPTDLVMKGLPSIQSVVTEVEHPKCILCRTNAGAITVLLQGIRDEKRPHLIGGGSDVVEFVKAARELKAGRSTSYSELCCFANWKEVEEYSKTTEGEDLALMVKLINDFGVEPILEALENMPDEKDADFVVSTAHKSKGREWSSVKLANDFPTANKMGDADRRLLYVAATRAKIELDISDCPPFTVRRDPISGEPIDVIEVVFTEPDLFEEPVDIFTPEEISAPIIADDFGSFAAQRNEVEYVRIPLAEYNELKAQVKAFEMHLKAHPTSNGVAKKKEKNTEEFSWYKVDGDWTACGPADMEGEEVEVVRQNGDSRTVTLGKAVKRFSDNWCYLVD